MSFPLRLAVAGCGRIARSVHLPALTRMRGVEVVGVADADPAALAAARRIVPRAVVGARYEELCERPDVDAVVVCLPSHLHAVAARHVLGAGKALYLEKPIAADVADARAVVAAGQQAARPAMIGFNYRFHPLVAALRRRAASGELGDLRGWHSTFAAPASDLPAWKTSLTTGGGVLLDFASHHVDLIRFVTGQEVREVTATTHPRGAIDEDTAEMHLVLESGTECHITCSWSSPLEDRIAVLGTRGTLTFDRHHSLGLKHLENPKNPANLKDLKTLRYAVQRLLAPRREPSYDRALAHFVACVRSGTPASPGLDDGLRSLEVILAARGSARDGRAVRVA